MQTDQSTAGALESRWLCMLSNRSCGTMMSNTYWSAQHNLKANTPSACLITATEVVPELSTCFVTSTEAITNIGVLSVTVPPVLPWWAFAQPWFLKLHLISCFICSMLGVFIASLVVSVCIAMVISSSSCAAVVVTSCACLTVVVFCSAYFALAI